MSAGSFANWCRVPATSRYVFSAFDACVTVDAQQQAQFAALGCGRVMIGGNLKADAPPLGVDPGALDALRAAVAGRPIFLAAQTHRGEERHVLSAHESLRIEYPDLLTIIVPRNIGRAPNLLRACGHRKVRLRSRNELPGKDTEIYIADTMNELGLFYRLVPFAFLGGTLVPIGGHNPFEPAQLGCGILVGPYRHNMQAAYTAILDAQGAGQLESGAELAAVFVDMMTKDASKGRIGAAAAAAAAGLKGATARSAGVIRELLIGSQSDDRVRSHPGTHPDHASEAKSGR
jgi:3-deoxy-D-manno-octulosonic-acid transferase